MTPKTPRPAPAPRPAAGAQTSRYQNHPEGTVIAKVGEPVRCLFVLVRGELEIISPREQIQTLTRLPDNARAAQIAAIANGRWTANIIARSAVTVVPLDFVEMFRLVERIKKDADTSIEQMNARLREQLRQIVLREEHIRKLEQYANDIEDALRTARSTDRQEDILPPESAALLDKIEEMREMESRMKSLYAENRVISDSNAILQRNLDALEGVFRENAGIKEQVDLLDAEVSEYRQRITELETALTAERARASALEEENRDLHDVRAFEAALDAIGGEVTTFEPDEDDPSLTSITEVGLAPPPSIAQAARVIATLDAPAPSELPAPRAPMPTMAFDSAPHDDDPRSSAPTWDPKEWPSFRVTVPTLGVDAGNEEEDSGRTTIVGPPPPSVPRPIARIGRPKP